MLSARVVQIVYYALLISAAMCFIGHGSFGIITKPIWCNYFAVVGIGHHLAYAIMPVLGFFDILMGLSLLMYPTRAILLWLVFWGLFTATLRPLSGEPFAELMERAGNFGAPLILILISGGTKEVAGSLFKKIEPPAIIDTQALSNTNYSSRAIVFLLMFGHGLLNLIGKQSLTSQYLALGFVNPHFTGQVIGLVELITACSILIRPFPSVLIVMLMWKMLSELFYPHWEFFEWIERGGSYGCIFTLWFITKFMVAKRNDKTQIRSLFVSDRKRKLSYSN